MVSMAVKKITLSDSTGAKRTVTMDLEDYSRVSKYSMFLKIPGGGHSEPVAYSNVNGTQIPTHRLIMKAKSGSRIRIMGENKLDLRRQNLVLLD
jgi:hypothetical protein